MTDEIRPVLPLFFFQSQDERYAFIAEWYDPNASLFRRYELLYYPKDSSIEMYDVKNRRTFLRRTKYESLHLEDLYVGSKVTVFSRHLTIVDYGNLYTSRKLGSRKESLKGSDFLMASEKQSGTCFWYRYKASFSMVSAGGSSRTLALIKPDGMRKIGELFDIIINAGLTITKAKMMLLSSELLQLIMSGPILAMELLGDDAVSKWRAIVGPANPTETEGDTLDSISESFGHCGLRDAAHGSDSVASAAKELELFFPSSGGRGPVSSAKFTNCTCCIIKPHAVNEGKQCR
ncbi:hypothetical protein Nmel_003153 [Mimus melanotis]